MSNLLKAEFYKLFHSWYFWGIGLFNLLLSSVLLLDSVGETSNLFFASIYNMPILYFLTIIFSALFVGNDWQKNITIIYQCRTSTRKDTICEAGSSSNRLHGYPVFSTVVT